jgi:hypothetical protein
VPLSPSGAAALSALILSRLANRRRTGQEGFPGLALPPFVVASPFNSEVVGLLRNFSPYRGEHLIAWDCRVFVFFGCRDGLVYRRGTLYCSPRWGFLNFLRSLSSLAPPASAGPLLGMRVLVGSCGRLGDLFGTEVSDTAGLGSGESGAKFKRPCVEKKKKNNKTNKNNKKTN